jgi:hypothetical protein
VGCRRSSLSSVDDRLLERIKDAEDLSGAMCVMHWPSGIRSPPPFRKLPAPLSGAA